MEKLINELRLAMEITLVPAFLSPYVERLRKYSARHPMASCMLSEEDSALLARFNIV
jgi:hypothetical protein